MTPPGSPMHGYNFTDRVRKVLHIAREEAARLRHGYVGTEHILLGIVREGEGVAAAVLINLNVDFEAVRQTVEEMTETGKHPNALGADLPYTSRAKKVLELAMSEARDLNHAYVGTEHLLLGVIREKKGIGAQALADLGVELEVTRDETRRLLGMADVFGTREPVTTHGVLFVLGASGAGKTAAVRALEARNLPGVRCYYFDTIGVPPEPGEAWQEDATKRWVERLTANEDRAEVAVLEGQTRPSFIQPWLARAGIVRARIVLLDCTAAVRAARLAGPRAQPDLATARMDGWAAYLRGQADALGLRVIDTSDVTIEAVADALVREIEALRARQPRRSA